MSECVLKTYDIVKIYGGQKVLNQDNDSTVEINLPAGSYIVKITTADGNVSVQRLIVK